MLPLKSVLGMSLGILVKAGRKMDDGQNLLCVGMVVVTSTAVP